MSGSRIMRIPKLFLIASSCGDLSVTSVTKKTERQSENSRATRERVWTRTGAVPAEVTSFTAPVAVTAPVVTGRAFSSLT